VATMIQTFSFILTTLIIAVTAYPSFAYKQKVIPSIGLKETYDSKVGYTEDEDFVHSIIPGLIYDLSTERSKAHFSGIADYSWYSKESAYDGFDQAYLLDLFHNATDRFVLGMKSSFTYDNNSKRSFEETGENLHAADRIVYAVSPFCTYKIDELTEMRMSYRINESNFQGYRHDNTYSDSMVHSFGTSIDRKLTELVSMGLTVSADLRAYDKEDGTNHEDQYKLSLLTRYRFSERTNVRFSVSGNQFYENEVNDESDTSRSINVSAGINHTVSERLIVDVFIGTGDQTTFDESGTLGLDVTWKGETWKLVGGYKKDITSGARGYDLKRDRIHARGEYLFNEKWRCGFQSVYVYSDQTDSDDDDEEKYTYYSMEPYLQYEIFKNSFIKAGYSYGVYMDRDADENITRNQVYIMYTMMFPYED
jgi:hypothetical protein